jgi:taurine--2-oxoglutarate transaminase
VKDRETREPLSPFNATSEPMQKLTKAALDRGLYLFVHWNVVVICPPLNITREELDEGLSVLDEVLALADEHVA